MSGWDQQFDIDGLNGVEPEPWSWRDEVKATILIVAALLVVVVTLFTCAGLVTAPVDTPPPSVGGSPVSSSPSG